MAVRRHAPAATEEPGEHVVQRDTGAVVGAVPDPLGEADRATHVDLQRHQDRQRPDQMRGEPGGQQPALAQRLVHQPELQLLQVPQPAVDQLAGPAGGTRREVRRLDQRDGQPAGGGVERGTDPGDATADDKDVEPLVAQPVEVCGTALRRQATGQVPGHCWITVHPSTVATVPLWAGAPPAV